MATSSSPPTAESPVRPRHRRTAVGLVLMLLGTLLALVGPVGSPAAALDRDGMTSISESTTPNFETYPGTLFPAGCTVENGQVLSGIQFRAVNQGAGINVTATGLTALPYLPAGTQLTMKWDDWVEGCDTPVSLSIKRAVGPAFDAATDQALLEFAGCSPDGANGITQCAVDNQGRFSLSMELPQAGADCSYQTDAVVGPPLEVVGPDGSFYGSGLRASTGKADGPNMLISADNEGPPGGAGPNCQPPVVTVECGEGGAVVTITNPDVFDDIRVDVLSGPAADDLSPVATDVEVLQDGGTAEVTVPLAIGEHPFIQVVDAQRELYGPTQFTEDCAVPEVTAFATCAEGGSIALDYSSVGPQQVTFTATVNGIPVTIDGDGSTLLTLAVLRALVGDVPIVIEIFANDQSVFTSDPLSCAESTASAEVACAEGTVTVTVVEGDDPTVDIVVTVNGSEVLDPDDDGVYEVVLSDLASIEDVTVVVTANGAVILDQTEPPCEEPLVAACVTGKTAVERFTAEDVYNHLDGQFAVQIDEATGTWTSTVPIDFIMVVENNSIVRSFVLPGNFTTGSFTATTVTVTVNGSPVVIQGVITDANGNPASAAAVGTVTSVTYCDGTEATTTTTGPEVLGAQQTQAQPAALPRTGAESSARMVMALGFILLGFGLVLLGQDRRLGLLVRRQ